MGQCEGIAVVFTVYCIVDLRSKRIQCILHLRKAGTYMKECFWSCLAVRSKGELNGDIVLIGVKD